MTDTVIYCVGKEHCKKLGETNNSWRGAMYLWNDLAKRYFNLPNFPHFDFKMMNRIWNTQNEHQIPKHEHIVLLSTMDKVLISISDAQHLIDAFEKYGEEHPKSSFSEQAKIIEKNLNNLPFDSYIAFNQTSVNSFYFDVEYDEDDNPIYQSLEEGWNLFEQFDEFYQKDKEKIKE